MQRWVSISVGLAAVVVAIAIAFKGSHPAKSATDTSPATLDAGAGGDLPARDLPGKVPTTTGAQARTDDLTEAGATAGESGLGGLAEGMPVPPLPRSAPRQVRFGVVLVSYSDAQPELTGSHTSHRSHADAKVLADKLAGAAAQDFHAAVQQGDPGSTDDVGTVKLGILEPAAEYVLFTLPVDGVGGPVDTPRGYWIVKRLE
jgi:hypothetical protein